MKNTKTTLAAIILCSFALTAAPAQGMQHNSNAQDELNKELQVVLNATAHVKCMAFEDGIITFSNLENVVDLINHGADVNIQDQDGNTALHLTAICGRKEIIGLLLAHQGTNPNIQDQSGNTPLHFAARCGRTGIVRLLLEHQDTDVNTQNQDGETALHIAPIENIMNITGYFFQDELDMFHNIIDTKLEIILTDDQLQTQIQDPLLRAFIDHNGIDLDLQNNAGYTGRQYLSLAHWIDQPASPTITLINGNSCVLADFELKWGTGIEQLKEIIAYYVHILDGYPIVDWQDYQELIPEQLILIRTDGTIAQNNEIIGDTEQFHLIIGLA